MAKVDYMELCKELSHRGHVVVLNGNDQHGRPLFNTVAVLQHCQAIINGWVCWGVVCVNFGTQETKWYPYNEVMGYRQEGQTVLDGLDRCLAARYRWMDRQEARDTREIVELMIGDLTE